MEERGGAEQAILAEARRLPTFAGVSTLRGSYLPTPKNSQVATFYPDRGFRTTGEGRFVASLPLTLVADHVTVQRDA